MRGFIGFLVIVAIVFFAVGETRGWYLGIPGQTPILVYKKDFTSTTTRRTMQRTDMPVRFTGDVRNGTVKVEVHYQRPSSFQTNTPAGQDSRIFEGTYVKGQRVALDRIFENGGGVYTVKVTYQDATGIFNLKLPGGPDL
ncbi:MAG: hypothetical protein WC972_00825 [Trueperaceae bacterium]|jgi:hypothetical protein|nr:hypothetical protein [Truepera sp.]HRN18892.1 hypothetical protein [Trueperaceae bacterium]HRQ11228.1 hypothetical protein [Trueperaceae bacterium]